MNKTTLYFIAGILMVYTLVEYQFFLTNEKPTLESDQVQVTPLPVSSMDSFKADSTQDFLDPNHLLEVMNTYLYETCICCGGAKSECSGRE